MHVLVATIALGVLAYAGTMVDNFLAFAAQLALTPQERVARLCVVHSTAVGCLVVLALGVGAALSSVPVRWVGILALAPWALAVHQWRHRRDGVAPSERRGAVTTFIVALGLGGDNLAIWTPLLRAAGPWRDVALVGAFALCQVVFVMGARSVAGHPRVVAWGQRRAPYLIPWLYAVLGVVILVECHVL